MGITIKNKSSVAWQKEDKEKGEIKVTRYCPKQNKNLLGDRFYHI